MRKTLAACLTISPIITLLMLYQATTPTAQLSSFDILHKELKFIVFFFFNEISKNGTWDFRALFSEQPR